MLRIAAAFAALLLSVGGAQAEGSSGPPGPAADPAKLAAAHAAAKSLIAAADASGYFTDITTDGIAKVRHDRSGLVCWFEVGAEGQRITIFGATPITDPGDDVGCNTRFKLDDATITETTYATRYKVPGLTSAMILESANRDIQRVHGSVRPWTGIKADVVLSDSSQKPLHPPIHSAWAEIDGPEGQPYFTKVSAVMIGAWALKQRTSAPKASGEAADVLSGPIFANIVADAVRYQSQAR